MRPWAKVDDFLGVVSEQCGWQKQGRPNFGEFGVRLRGGSWGPLREAVWGSPENTALLAPGSYQSGQASCPERRGPAQYRQRRAKIGWGRPGEAGTLVVGRGLCPTPCETARSVPRAACEARARPGQRKLGPCAEHCAPAAPALPAAAGAAAPAPPGARPSGGWAPRASTGGGTAAKAATL